MWSLIQSYKTKQYYFKIIKMIIQKKMKQNFYTKFIQIIKFLIKYLLNLKTLLDELNQLMFR